MSAQLSHTIELPVIEQPLPMPFPLVGREPQGDFLSIRGVRLPLGELVDRAFLEPQRRADLHRQLEAAKPFPHLVVDGLFHPALLELVAEEFDMQEEASWADVKSRYERLRRSGFNVRLGPATQLYFDIVNSGWFGEWLASVSGAPYLLPDPKLFGGGLHESRTGATFAVHRDFNRHPHLGLKNEMVFITYLNKGWDPEWGSGLELWDRKRSVSTVQPEFGRTIVLPHGPNSYHGHTKPLQAADGRPRRSVAAYFYSSEPAGRQHGVEAGTVFMQKHRVDQVKAVARMLTPPLLWGLARRVIRR
jgi:hypothetical protein